MINLDTVIDFSNRARFMFNNDKVIIVDRISGLWMKVPKECYDILTLCSKERLSKNNLDLYLADDEDRDYMTELIEKLYSIGCLYDDYQQEIKEINFIITRRCNLNCIHCMADAEYGGTKDYYNTSGILSIIDKIITVNPERIILTGGEPLIRIDFFDILRYIKKNYQGKIILMTNATLINKGNVDEIVSMIDKIDISIDGVDEETCSVIRGKGVFNKVISSIHLLKEKNFNNISLSMVESNNNKPFIKEFYSLNDILGTKPVLRVLSYDGRASENKEILDSISDNVKDKVQDIEETHPFPVGIRCTAGYDQITIDDNGDIYPCTVFSLPQFKMAHISEVSDLRTVVQTNQGHFISPSIQKYEPCEYERCKDCNVNYFCWYCPHEIHSLNEREIEERCKYYKRELSSVWL